FERFGKAEELAVVGVSEVLAHYDQIKAVFNKLVDEAKKRRPKAVVLMDYPGFNLKLAKELHTLGIPTVYYISPQVWAWKKGRVKIMKKYCTEVLVVFPFEKKFYDEKGVPCEFVGHPLLDELDEKYFQDEYRKMHRRKCGIKDDQVVVGLMPGSRKKEIEHHLPILMQVATELYRKNKNVMVAVLAAPSVEKEQLAEKLDGLNFPYMLLKSDPMDMIHLTDVVLAASGTATLMVGLLEKPMVIIYKVSAFTALMARLLVHGVKFFGIVNLIMEKEVVPERFQERANLKELTRLMSRAIEDPAYRGEVIANLRELKNRLGNRGATEKVAARLEKYFA
ncbi:MAG: lipid-A-disaccharide synthase, partial [Pseudobdellovibrionaceae bacterium]